MVLLAAEGVGRDTPTFSSMAVLDSFDAVGTPSGRLAIGLILGGWCPPRRG
jgi:hypothetical protein